MKCRYLNKYLLCLIIIGIIFLSGCLGKIQTYERQVCLTITHYSKTSIFDCSKQSSCYNKLDSYSKINNSENLPKEIENKLEIYKNSISSSIYYFNKSKDELDKINSFCEHSKTKEVIDIYESVYDVFFYISNIFTYLDKASQTSIETIKDYSIFLKNQDVNYISEEELYSKYIILNNNLNELKTQEINNKNNYISEIKKDCKILNDLAKEFGFKKSYISKVMYIDLYAYYLDFTNIIQKNKIPKYSYSSSYIIKKVSNLEAFRKLNISLSRTDNYNLYLFFDKVFGLNNSTHTDFAELINSINTSLDQVYEKINEYEKYCLNNKEYLSIKSKRRLILDNHNYKYNNLSFGKYLDSLKKLKQEIEINKIKDEELIEKQEKKINKCNKIVKLDIVSNNFYLQRLKEQYLNEENYINKIKYCEKLKKNILLKDNCLDHLNMVLEEDIDDFSYLEYLVLEDVNQNKCENIVFNINNKLEFNNQILKLNNIIENIESKIDNFYLLNTNKDKERIESYAQQIKDIKTKTNIEKIINIDEKINRCEDIYKNVLNINKENLEIYVLENYKIIYNNEKYYLKINNVFDYLIENLEIDNMDLKKIISLDNDLKIKDNKLKIIKLNINENLFEIDYDNDKEVITEILKLKTNRSILKTKIKNKITGLENVIYVGQIQTPSSLNYKYDKNTEEIKYITKKENIFIYYKDLIEENNLSVDIEELDGNKYVIRKQISLKNIYDQKIDQLLYLDITNENDQIIIKDSEDNKINYSIEEKEILFNIKLKVFEKKIYSIYKLKNKESLYLEIEDLTNKIVLLQNSRFENIKDEMEDILNNYDLDEKIFYKENLDIENIQKIFSAKYEIINLFNKNKEYEKYDDDFIILFNNIKDDLEYQDIYSKKEFFDLYDNRLENIILNLEILKNIENEIIKSKAEDLNKDQEEIDQEIENIENTIKDYNIIDSSIIKELENIKNNKDSNYMKIDNLKKNINSNLNTKLEELYEKIKIYASLDFNIIKNNLKIINLQYEDCDIRDLHSVNIYPELNSYDVERINKKIKFLETVKLQNQLNNFYKYYNTENVEKALKSVEKTTLDRLESIKNESELVISFIEKYKALSKEKIDLQKNLEKKELYKNYFLEKKYLYIIYLSKLKNTKQTNKIDNFSQNIIILALIFIFFLLFMYFKGKKKKIDYNTKKKKILRKY